MPWLKPYQCLKQSAQSVAHHGYLWCRPMRTRSSTNRKMPLHVSLMPRKQSDRRTSGSSNPSCIAYAANCESCWGHSSGGTKIIWHSPKPRRKVQNFMSCAPPQTLRAYGMTRASALRPGQLVPIYGWFTEGFDTPVLKEAKTLLINSAANEHGADLARLGQAGGGSRASRSGLRLVHRRV